jgi:hypothetical protein
MPFLDNLASERSGGQIALFQVWNQVYTELLSLRLDEPDTRKLATACTSPSQVRLMARVLRGSPEKLWNALQERVDESDASLCEWIDALVRFYAWSDSHGRSAPFLSVLGYLSCTEEAVKDMRLAEAVVAMLDQYGFEG